MIDLLDISQCKRLENQGYCNENFLCLHEGQKYILRKLLRRDIDRDFEYKVHTLAYAQNLTAKPIEYNKTKGQMLFEFVEGEHRKVLDTYALNLLAEALKSLHSIAVDSEPIKLIIKNKTSEVSEAWDKIAQYPKEYVLCHNDLNSQNILWNDTLKFIDWEYAGVNDRYFDLACVCVEFGLDRVLTKYFLDSYFIRQVYVLEKLEAYKCIYRALCADWFDKNQKL